MDRCHELIDSCVITLRVLCILLVRCLSPCSMCPDCVVCANSTVSTVWWCRDGDRSLPLWWGPQGSLWRKCVQQGLMQPHHHSSRRNGALPACVWDSSQFVRCKLWDIHHTVCCTLPPCVGLMVLGLWDVQASCGECSAGERLPWRPAARGSVSLPQRDPWCRVRSELFWHLTRSVHSTLRVITQLSIMLICYGECHTEGRNGLSSANATETPHEE